MAESTVNIPLLRKAVEWAEAEAARPPELSEWFQGAYILPSEADVHDFLWNGKPMAGLNMGAERREMGKAAECGTCFCIAGKAAHEATGNVDGALAAEVAMDALGLTHTQAADLFDGNNSIEAVRRIAESIAGERL